MAFHPWNSQQTLGLQDGQGPAGRFWVLSNLEVFPGQNRHFLSQLVFAVEPLVRCTYTRFNKSLIFAAESGDALLGTFTVHLQLRQESALALAEQDK